MPTFRRKPHTQRNTKALKDCGVETLWIPNLGAEYKCVLTFIPLSASANSFIRFVGTALRY
jgi:hypothetical protein